jgi:WD40 repeat protein
VLGTRNTLLVWTKDREQSHANPPRGVTDLGQRLYSEIVRHFRLDPEAIDWTRGRVSDRQIQTEFDEITSMCAVGRFLAVASRRRQSIHIFAGTWEIIQRLVGHTMSISSLLPFGDKQLLSGSADKTIKLWNLDNGTVKFSLVRHGVAVSAIEVREYRKNTFLFTGGEDHIIHTWDITRKKSMFQLFIGEGKFPTALYFDPDEKELQIVALLLTDQELDERDQIEQVAELQAFTFSKYDDDAKP